MATALDGLGRQIANVEPTSASAAIGDVRQELAPKLAKLVVGQQLRGEIISKLTDGSFTVKVAGFTAKMILPKEFSQGDAVPLRLISVQPRPTFLLDNQPDDSRPLTTGTQTEQTEDSADLSSLTQKNTGRSGSLPERNIPPAKPGGQDVVLHLSEDSKQLEQNKAQEQPSNTRLERSTSLTRPYTEAAQAAAPAKVLANAPITNANATAAELAENTATSAPTSLSQTAKVISQVLTSYAQIPESSVVKTTTPVIEQAPQLQHTAELATRLQHQIERSGLFYEAHLAQWAEGKLSLHELKLEPQAQIQTPADNPGALVSNPVNSDSLNQLLNSQLQVLEQHKLIWQGELFPGQKMEWQIQKDPSGQAQKDSEQAVWYSNVRFELPNLGTIEARLHLSGNQLGLNLSSNQAGTVELLKEQLTVLSNNLQNSGTDLTSFNAKLDE